MPTPMIPSFITEPLRRRRILAKLERMKRSGLPISRRHMMAGSAAAAIAPVPAIAQSTAAGPVAPTWESLAQHFRVPDWFADAKFGIWAHWGAQCQPEWGDWYARLLYMTDRPSWMKGETAYEHHLKR